MLLWENNAETSPGFAGYRLYRTEGQYSPDFQEIFACGTGTANTTIVNSYEDLILATNTGYHYYITTFDDGSSNDGISLESSKCWTRTNRPAILTVNPVILTDLYVDPTGDDNNTAGNIEGILLKTR